MKHYLVPSPKENIEGQSKETPCSDVKPGITKKYETKGYVYTDPSLDSQAVSYEYTPLCAVSRPLPVKNLEFHESHSDSLTLGSSQAPVAKASRSDMLTFSTAVQSPQQGFYSPESKSFCQTTAAPVGLSVKPPFYRDLSSPGYVPLFQPKPASFDYSMTPSPVATSVTWSIFPGPGREIPPAVSSQVGDSSVVLTSTSSSSCHDKLAQTPYKSNFTAPSNHSQPSYVTQWAPATRSTSTSYFVGPSRNTGNSLRVEEPVDAFIDKLSDGQETVFQLTFTGLQTDSSVALLRAQEQQRLPPLELFKFTGKPIE